MSVQKHFKKFVLVLIYAVIGLSIAAAYSSPIVVALALLDAMNISAQTALGSLVIVASLVWLVTSLRLAFRHARRPFYYIAEHWFKVPSREL